MLAVGLLAGLAPAVVVPGAFNPFLPGKAFVLAVGVAAVVLAAGAVRVPAARWAVAAGAAVIGLTLLAAATSAAPLASVLGTPTRQLGAMAWFGFALAGSAGAGLASRHSAMTVLRLVARWCALPVLVGGLLAVSELAGRPLVPTAIGFEGRVLGLFGNPGLTAAHLATVLPLVVGAALSDDGRWRRLHWASAAVGAGTLLATQSRAAAVAVALALVALALRDRLPRRIELRGARPVVAVVLVGVVVAGALLASGRWDGAGDTLGGRVDTWVVASRVIAAQPALGTGPEGFGAAFVRQVDEGFVLRHTRDQLTDRAHSQLLDVTATAGVPAGLALLALLVGCAVLLVRRLGDGPLVAGAALAVLATWLQQQVLFPQPVHDTLVWFVVGVVLAASTRPLHGWSRWPAAVLTAGLVAWASVGVAADVMDAAAYDGRAADGVVAATRAVALQPTGELHGLVLSDRALASGDVDVMRAAEATLARLEERTFPTGLVRLARVDLLQRIHQRSDGGDRDALTIASGLLDELLATDPTNGDAWLKLGVVRHEQGRQDEAVAAWRRALVLLPGRSEPQKNLDAVGAAP